MSADRPVTILCLASYFKGITFLTAAKESGARVMLVTREKLRNEPWPWDSIDEVFYMPDLRRRPDIVYGVSYLMRGHHIDRIVPLDDYDVETAAHLREHLRLPGLNESTSRFFRDKLAMRVQAQASGLAVPPFAPVFNYDKLRAFMDSVPPPWVLKPRSEAGAMGIKKCHNAEEVWRWLDQLGDEQSFFHLEKFLPGDVYHVDSVVWQGEVALAVPHKYMRPPLHVAHDGGVFRSRTLSRAGDEAQALLDFNRQLLSAFGLQNGVTHAEFIRGESDGRYYFLEVAARVGGANTEQLVAFGSGANPWAEWAKMEVALAQNAAYQPPVDTNRYAGVAICLARQERPDLGGYQEPEIVYRLHKSHHAGLIVAGDDPGRIEWLLHEYGRRFSEDFLAVAPPLDKPPT